MIKAFGSEDHGSGPPRLALRAKEAAEALGISERLLWDWTRGEGVPHVRIGNVVLYPVSEMRHWLRCRAMEPAEEIPGSVNAVDGPH